MPESKPATVISNKLEHLLLVMLLVAMAGLSVHFNLLWRWDNLLYDSQLSLWNRQVSDNIIIVAIDDESLNQIGHWPWPRSVHAQLIREIDAQSPQAIGLDILFSEPDSNNPASDQQLSDAMRESGKVVLPVYMTQQSRNSVPIEALPLPELTRYAAQLGHVHVDISEDGIARRVFLREGIGKPQWLHYSLAILGLIDKTRVAEISKDQHDADHYSAMQWSRELPYLIPYAGGPGHFPMIGYSQVLSGQYPRDLFRNKIVLIGATAEGMGDALPTPVSGNGGSMSGVEIIANVINGIQQRIQISQINTTLLILLTLLLVALPMLIYPLLNPSYTLLLMFGMLLLSSLLTAIMLWGFGIWVPVSTILLFQLLSYPLWSWRRLVLAMRHLNEQLDQLLNRQSELTLRNERNLVTELEFLSEFVPLTGWVLLDARGHRLLHRGNVPLKIRTMPSSNQWQSENAQYWAKIQYQNQPCLLGVRLQGDQPLNDQQQRLMDNLINVQPSGIPRVHYLTDVLQTRIARVQSLGQEYESLHRIIDDSLSAMADGVLIGNSHGQVILSNKRSSWYLRANDNTSLNGKSVLQALSDLQPVKISSWKPLLHQVLIDQQRVIQEARHSNGRDLMVEISPLQIIGEQLPGVVVNLTDISILKQSERDRSEVLNFLSHDLRSPLSSMIAMIELAKNKTSLQDVQDMLVNMEKNTYKTLHLAEQFLQLSRANTTQNIEFHEIDFNTLALNAIDQMWALSNKLQVPIHYQFDGDELWTNGEADLLERAIVNLISNALKHSQPLQPVNVTLQLKQHYIECCVIDSGTGIEPGELPHLFEMFRRTRGAGVERKQGIGLGLAFVDAVARRHSGTVEVNSTPGKGSSFCLKIPQLISQ